MKNSLGENVAESAPPSSIRSALAISRLIQDPRFKAADESEIDAIIAQAVADNPKEAEAARTNPRAIQAFMGKVMRASKGKASPQVVQAKLKAIFDPN